MSRRNRTKFEPEFKVEVVRLVLEESRTINAVAQSLGIYSSSLADWVKQAKIDRGKGPPGALKTEELKELRRLRKRIAS